MAPGSAWFFIYRVMSVKLELIQNGGITSVPGIQASGVACGLKPGEKDLALIFSREPARIAAVFTTNQVKAAPIVLCRERLKNSPNCQAIVINSGYANACTGEPGMELAKTMAALTAEALGIPPELVWVASTGVIGELPPLEPLIQGINSAARELNAEGGHAAALAIMTTDTRPKEIAVRVKVEGCPPGSEKWITVAGMAKGAGMICPQMATMLAFLATDAQVENPALQLALKQSVETSFNRITVDGDTSTNDMVALLSPAGEKQTSSAGDSIAKSFQPCSPEWAAFLEALNYVTQELAKKIVEDGEGATKLIEVLVKRASASEDARKAAFSVAKSSLVKTSLSGGQLNWGRILAAVGYADVMLVPDKLDCYIGDIKIVSGGVSLGAEVLAAAEAKLCEPRIAITLDLGLGEAEERVWTCDFSAEYVRINADYHT